jgi:hypothetical protein
MNFDSMRKVSGSDLDTKNYIKNHEKCGRKSSENLTEYVKSNV